MKWLIQLPGGALLLSAEVIDELGRVMLRMGRSERGNHSPGSVAGINSVRDPEGPEHQRSGTPQGA